MTGTVSGRGRVVQSALPFLPAQARAVGPSAGLLEDPDGGVVYVFGMATFAYGVGDAVGRRLAAVQLVATRAASKAEVASSFGVSTVTLWRWEQDFAANGVLGLVPARTGPRGPSKLTAELAARIVAFDAGGASLRSIATQTGVSTDTVRVALGRGARPSPPRPMEPGVEPVEEADHSASDTEAAADHDTAQGGGDPGGDNDEDAAGAGELVVLARPAPRTAERVAASFGLLEQAPVVITEGASLPQVGVLLGLPALEVTGLLEVAEDIYGRMRNGFYGLRAVLLMGVFMALLREPRAEGATRLPPADVGRLLGLDRAPEVKTIRRKLTELANLGKGAALQAALGAHHVAARPEAVGLLYIDGHVRVYTGGRPIPKTHIARMRIAGPATEETWVGDSDGDPVMVLTAAPSQSLAAELARLLPELRTLVGDGRRCTIVFDRGGYSPAVFTEIIAAGFDILTYYKGVWARSPLDAFTTAGYTTPEGIPQSYELAERIIELPVPARHDAAGAAVSSGTVSLRLIVRRSPDGHQTPILTNRTDLSAAEIAYKMANRWRQENYFKYAREHFALDALDSYADNPDDMARLVPNPDKADALGQVAAARAEVAAANAGLTHAIEVATIQAGKPGNDGKATVDPAADHHLVDVQARLAQTKQASREVPSHLPLAQVRPDSRLLETERKLLTHAIRMSAYNTESALARLLRPHYSRGDDEARALLREAFTLPGDLEIVGDTLHVRLNPASAPRRSNALAALCAELTDTHTRYPGTNLVLAYSIKGHPTP